MPSYIQLRLLHGGVSDALAGGRQAAGRADNEGSEAAETVEHLSVKSHSAAI